MGNELLRGSCLCGAVTYEVKALFLRFDLPTARSFATTAESSPAGTHLLGLAPELVVRRRRAATSC